MRCGFAVRWPNVTTHTFGGNTSTRTHTHWQRNRTPDLGTYNFVITHNSSNNNICRSKYPPLTTTIPDKNVARFRLALFSPFARGSLPLVFVMRRRCFFPRTKLTSMSPLGWARMTRTKNAFDYMNVTQLAGVRIFTGISDRNTISIDLSAIVFRMLFEIFVASNRMQLNNWTTSAIAFEVGG